MIMQDIQSMIQGIDKYRDKIFICPLTSEQIVDLENSLKIKFPNTFLAYLSTIGIFQDLICEEMFTFSDYLLEKDFIKRAVRDNPDKYFAFSRDGYGNLLALKDASDNDEHIYFINHESGKVSRQKLTFLTYVYNKIQDAINNYDDRKLNEDKAWMVQFSFRTNNEKQILEILKDRYGSMDENDWRFVEKTKAGVTHCEKTLVCSKKLIVISRLEYEKWDCPNFSFDFQEPVLVLKNNSEIEKLDILFRELSIRYKMVNYGIL